MIVPLPDLALQILEGLPKFECCDYVFTARKNRPVSGFAFARAKAQRASGVTGWHLHDLRRTCRTGLARLKVPEIVAERCLNHAPKGLSKVYNVHEYQDEKAEAFQKWADEIRLITNPPEKVVRLDPGVA
jgi:integrase